MENNLSKRAQNIFEQIRQVDENGNEFWSARDLGKVLEYLEFRHFVPLIDRAKKECKNIAQLIENHFEDMLDMVKIGLERKGIYSVEKNKRCCSNGIYSVVANDCKAM